jgi:hypothetical protein
MKTGKLLTASIASAAAVFVLPIIMMLFELYQPSALLADGTPDNAPVRAAGIFILLSPVLVVVVAFLTFLIGVALGRIGQLKPRGLGVTAIVVAVLGGIALSYDRPFGWRDMATMFFESAAWLTVCTSLSAFVWWKVWSREGEGQHDA